MEIIWILLLLIAFGGMALKYKDAKADPKIMKEFKNECIFGIITLAICVGLLYTCMYDDSSSKRKRIDKGYTSDPDYSPTFDSRGDYHNNGTGDRQIQYQGSREQQRDLDAIDKYSRDHPGF